MVSVEDLWDLPVEDLDSIFKTLNFQAKKAKEESLLVSKTKEDATLVAMIEIVKYIVSVKLEEESLRVKAKELKEQKQKILEVLASKQDESLKEKSIEELTEMLNQLEV